MKVVVAGASAIGLAIAEELAQSGHRVVLIDKKSSVLDSKPIPGVTLLHADACDLDVLRRINLETYDIVVAASGDDRVNLVLSLFAKTEFAVPRVVARVNDQRNDWLFEKGWGVDAAISSPQIFAALVEEAVNVGQIVRLLPLRRKGTDFVSLTLPDITPLAGRLVKSIQLPRDTALVAVVRESSVLAPQEGDTFEPADELVFVASTDRLTALAQTFQVQVAHTSQEQPRTYHG